MNELIELANVEINEYCMLNRFSGEKTFSSNKKTPGFTGLYFKDSSSFFAVYPSKNGPIIFFKGKEYEINRNLSITLFKQDKKRKFHIVDYNIEVNYMESPYIGFDVWSDELDVDLFFMIEQSYKDQSFYDKYTLKSI